MKRTLLAFALLALCCSRASSAGWSPTASESVPIIADTTITQGRPSVEVDGAGGVLVLWRDARTGALRPVMQRLRFDGERFPGWPVDGLVLSTGADSVSGCVMVSDSAGGAIVAWSEARGANPMIYAQHVLASGQLDPRWPVNGLALATGNSIRRNPAICTDGAGGAFVAWEDSASAANGWDVRARRVLGNSSLAPGPVAVCTTIGDQTKIALLADSLGGAFLAWGDARAVRLEIYGAHLLADAGEVDGPANGTALAVFLPRLQQGPQFLPNGAGGVLLIWGDAASGQYLDHSVHARRFDSALRPDSSWRSDLIFYIRANDPAQAWRVASDGAGGVLASVTYYSFATEIDEDYFYTCGVHITHAGTQTPQPFPFLFLVPNQGSWWLTQPGPLVPLGTEGALLFCPLRNIGASSGIDLFAMRVLPDGTRDSHWSAEGNVISSGPDMQDAVVAVSDGTGGAIAVWSDNRRPGLRRLYAQRVERFGRLGQPGATISSLRDIANDQGGRLRVSWNPSRLDVSPANTITRYEVWRQDGSGPAAPWVLAGSQPARQFAGYSMVISTPTDSVPGGSPTKVMVRAVADDVAEWWDSWSAEGWSVDDIAPLTPTEFASQHAPGNVTLTWRANLEPDLAGYRLYGGHEPSFVPGPSNFIAQVAGPQWSHAPGTYDWYKLQAVDAHENGSEFVSTQVMGVTGVGDSPLVFAFLAPQPNPSSRRSALRFTLPAPTRVVLSLYDTNGRRVHSLVDGNREAGEHAVDWDLHDEAGRRMAPGLYFARLTANGRTFTHRLVVLD